MAKARRPAARGAPEPVLAYCAQQDLELATYPSVEAQVAAAVAAVLPLLLLLLLRTAAAAVVAAVVSF